SRDLDQADDSEMRIRLRDMEVGLVGWRAPLNHTIDLIKAKPKFELSKTCSRARWRFLEGGDASHRIALLVDARRECADAELAIDDEAVASNATIALQQRR